MRICPCCGSSMEDSFRFCGNCGTALPAAQAAAQETAFCPNCGERPPVNSLFCPNCGAGLLSPPADQPQAGQQPTDRQPCSQPPTDQQPCSQPPTDRQPCSQPPTDQQPCSQPPTDQPPTGGKAGGSKLLPRVIGILAAVAAVAALVAVGIKVVPGFFPTPARQFVSYHEKLFLNGVLSGMESGVDRFGSGSFSADLTVTASVNDPEINEYLAGSSLKLGIDLGKDSSVIGGELVLMGSPVLNGTVTYEDGQFGFLLPQAYDAYYVMDLEKVVKNLTGEDVDLDAAQRPELSGKQWRALIEAYLDVVYTAVTDENVTMEKDVIISLPGLNDSFTGTLYIFTPTAEDIENMLLRLADRLENDRDLRDAIRLAVLPSVSFAAYDSPHDFSMEDELNRAILKLAGELRNEAARIGREAEDSGFAWTLAVEGDNVRQIRISVRGGGSACVYEAKGAGSGGRTELIYAVSNGERQDLVERTYTKKGSICDGRIAITYGAGAVSADPDGSSSNIPSERRMILDYKYDSGKTSVFGIPYGEYRLSGQLFFPGESASISLTVAAGANGGVDHKLSIRSDEDFYYFYEDYYRFTGCRGINRLELTVNATDRSTVGKPGRAPVDISGRSEEEFEELFYNIGYTLAYELAYNSLLGNGGGPD